MNESDRNDVTRDQPVGPAAHDDGDLHEIPQRIGRYRIEKVLGKGGFGLVYLAHDEQLNRPVAVKVPHARLISKAGRRRGVSGRGPDGGQSGPSRHRPGL